MNTTKKLSQIKEIFQNKSTEEQIEFETQMLALLFLSEIEKEADRQGINRKELSDKIGKSSSYVTQLFRGNKTPNLKILTEMGLALGITFNVEAVSNIEEARRLNNENISGPKFDSNKVAERRSDIVSYCPSFTKDCTELNANLSLNQV